MRLKQAQHIIKQTVFLLKTIARVERFLVVSFIIFTIPFCIQANTYTVTSINDLGPGSFRSAIASAILDQNSRVDFSLPDNSTIQLQGPLDLQGSIAINTNNIRNLTIQSDGANTSDFIIGRNILFSTSGTIRAFEKVDNYGKLSLNEGSRVLNAVNNFGNITLPRTSTPIQVSGIYSQAAGSTLSTVVQDKNQYGRLSVGPGSSLAANSTIQVILPDQGASISNGDHFKIVEGVASTPQLSYPKSPLLSFVYDNAFEPNTTTLKAVRTPIGKNVPTAFKGLGNTLENLREQNSSSALVAGLLRQPSQSELNSAVSQLAPAGINGGTIFATLQTLQLSLEKVFDRLALMRDGIDPYGYYGGYSAGDMEGSRCAYGPFLFGNTLKQNERNGVSGYTTVMGGVGALGDTPFIAGSSDSRIGIAVSYAATAVRTNSSAGNVTTINSGNGIIYGSTEYGPLFADAAASIGVNWYRGKRNILFLNETALSNYKGVQYLAKARGGFSIAYGALEISPMATIQSAYLNQGSYSENGAPTANLFVVSQKTNATQLGVGGRLCDISQPDEFLPEIHVLYIQDLKVPSLQVTSSFLEGGGLFVVQGPRPPKEGVNVGGSITAMMTDQLLLMANYDLIAKKGFTSNSASIKFRYLF